MITSDAVYVGLWFVIFNGVIALIVVMREDILHTKTGLWCISLGAIFGFFEGVALQTWDEHKLLNPKPIEEVTVDVTSLEEWLERRKTKGEK